MKTNWIKLGIYKIIWWTEERVKRFKLRKLPYPLGKKWSYGLAVHCPHCYEIQDQFYGKLNLPGGGVETGEYPCDHCGKSYKFTQ